MGRVRFSRAEAEATRRAAQFVVARAGREEWRNVCTVPDDLAPKQDSSKNPVVWVAIYAPVPPEGSVIDGGELFVVVDLELDTVAVKYQ
jgi:hypothetical protein